MKFDFAQRQRIENEVLPAVIDDPEYAACEIVKLEAKIERLRKAIRQAAEIIAGLTAMRRGSFFAGAPNSTRLIAMSRIFEEADDFVAEYGEKEKETDDRHTR